MSDEPLIEIDGQRATPGQLRAVALAGYGHFTAMQVRRGRVCGLEPHLARLAGANSELFGTSLDGELVRHRIRHALSDRGDDASVRVYVVDTHGGPAMVVTVRPPANMPGAAWKLRSVPYQRPAPHLKHASDFGQTYYRNLVQRGGFDEALLTGPDGVIAEGGITNVGFWDGSAVTWPDAPALAGITMGLLEPRLPGHGLPSRRALVRLADLGSFRAAFVTNARGIAPVSQIDGLSLQADATLIQALTAVFEGVPWDPI